MKFNYLMRSLLLAIAVCGFSVLNTGCSEEKPAEKTNTEEAGHDHEEGEDDDHDHAEEK
ncbi:MAG: hypothetical protein ACI87E_003108 [Mariniblastus sp.]|jgi:hypothetical protein